MQEQFPEDDGIYQHDLAPCHTSRPVRKFLDDKNVEVLPWPGNSPDMNPIENLWAIVKKRITAIDCREKTSLWNAIKDIWENDEELPQMCDRLVSSMPRRVQLLAKSRGGHTKY